MSKHPLLPDTYTDKAIQTAILYALSPYKVTERMDISNPMLKWDLNTAWTDAEALLERGGWRYKSNEDETEIGFELLADTDAEIAELNTVIAGIVACQILEPEDGFSLQRIAHRKGGEMVVAVSSEVGEKLKQKFPSLLLNENTEEKAPEKKESFLNWKNWIKK